MPESTTLGLYERVAPSKLISDVEIDLRQRGFDRPEEVALAANEAVARWTRVLELSLLFASLNDAAQRLGLRTVADMYRDSHRLDALVATLSRLDVLRVVRENASELEPLARFRPHADAPASADSQLVVRSVQSLLLNCPIVEIERAARAHLVQEHAHRCRLAYDGLRAFVARHVHPEQEAIAAAGHVYAEGRASIDEVAAMLGVAVPDVVALLEDHGFRRSVDGLRLSEDTRRRRLEQIRRDRLARGGQPESSPSAVARDVIASQRIEGIDARPWLRW
jgi:hypothetical protein